MVAAPDAESDARVRVGDDGAPLDVMWKSGQ